MFSKYFKIKPNFRFEVFSTNEKTFMDCVKLLDEKGYRVERQYTFMYNKNKKIFTISTLLNSEDIALENKKELDYLELYIEFQKLDIPEEVINSFIDHCN